MNGYPYTGSPVNIYQTPYNPQTDELQKLIAEFQLKYNQVLQGNMQIPNQNQNIVSQQEHQVAKDDCENYQKMVLGYLYDVHGITAQQFEWEFEEYCNIIAEKEKQKEQEIKQKVREKFYKNEPLEQNFGNSNVEQEEETPPVQKINQKFSNIKKGENKNEV